MQNELAEKRVQLPNLVRDNLELFESFVSLCYHVLRTLLSSLSDALKLEDTARLENYHRDGELSTTNLVLLHYPQNASPRHSGQIQHTDVGSLTLLFIEQWGLQVLIPETKEWTFIQPRGGHGVVNIGDALRFLSGKRLKSCLHRVVPPSGWYQKESRYSIAYFLRPENETIFKDPDGNFVSAKVWHDKKFVMLSEPHDTQNASQMATGGMAQVLLNES